MSAALCHRIVENNVEECTTWVQSYCRRAVGPFGPAEAVKYSAADLMLLEHHGNGLLLIESRASRAECARSMAIRERGK